MVKVIYRNFYSGRVMCFMNLDFRRFRFTLATFCSFQYLKELFFSIFISPSPDPPSLRSESGCKGKAYFSLSKFFQAFFQTFFLAPRLTSFPRALSLESGCKITHFFANSNFYTTFFDRFPKFFRKTLETSYVTRHIFLPDAEGGGKHAQ